MKRTVLVTGGTGFIGSHTVVSLIEHGHQVVVVDDLSNSSVKALDAIKKLTDANVIFHQVDMTDEAKLAEVFDQHPIDSVIHFAGLKAVGESVEKPLWYFRTNMVSTINLLNQMEANDVFDLVFSSSATVYGVPEALPLVETGPTGATNPYGRTKLMIEDMCREIAACDSRWRISLLRYFNPIGAHPSGELGEDPKGIPNNLVPYVMQVAVGRREKVQVFGDNWDTPDGSGVRDYIHVVDLAAGHLAALEHLDDGCEAFNLGTGTGYSVLDVIKTAANVSGQDIPYDIVDRRDGDIATSVADPSKAVEMLDWRADRSLDVMLHDAWNWQSNHPNGFADEAADG